MNLTSFQQSTGADSPHYLLFGHPVEHSFSPLMHNTSLDYYGMNARYHAIDLQNNELSELAVHMNHDHFMGANITIPYKQIITDYLDQIDRSARNIGAVNTIVKHDYSLEGYNTDLDGFLSPLQDYVDEIAGSRVIVFGTGGASRAIVVALQKVGVEEIYLISRTPGRITFYKDFDYVQVRSYSEWTSLAEGAALIVNATPLGMYPKVDQSPVRDTEQQFLAEKICYDIVYNPLKTKFLKQADKTGAKTIGGLEMLIQQGSKSFELWTGKPFPIKIIREKLHEEIKN